MAGGTSAYLVPSSLGQMVQMTQLLCGGLTSPPKVSGVKRILTGRDGDQPGGRAFAGKQGRE